MTEAWTGARILVECLVHEGTEVVFGIPGGVTLPLYDALCDAKIRHVLTRHEQGAIHAADGYARAAGRVGVVMATSGPGATNLVTGLANAAMDSVPLVAITGQVATTLLGTDSFQEADTTGITLPVTKHSYLVRDVRDLPRVVREAFHIAATGRPGPVLIDLPRDVAGARAVYRPVETVELRGYRPTQSGHPIQIQRAAAALAGAHRPLLCAGGGVLGARAWAEFRQLAELADAPVVATLMGLGTVPADHPAFLGMIGMHGAVAANHAVQNCDLLVGVGMRFDDRATGRTDGFAPRARIVHVDVDPAEVGKNVGVHIPVVGDAQRVLTALVAASCGLAQADRSGWWQTIRRWQADQPPAYALRPGSVVPQQVVEEISRQTEGNALVVTDVGQHQMWTAQFYRFRRPRSFITSGGLGAMGYGLPAAVGAQVAAPGETVVLITGDGSLQMTLQELATVATERLPIKVFIINNRYLGMVRQWQQMFYANRYSQVDLGELPDWVTLAAAYGIPAWRVERPEQVEPVVATALASPGPALVDVKVHPEENVFPMVPAGARLDEMLTGRPEPEPVRVGND